MYCLLPCVAALCVIASPNALLWNKCRVYRNAWVSSWTFYWHLQLCGHPYRTSAKYQPKLTPPPLSALSQPFPPADVCTWTRGIPCPSGLVSCRAPSVGECDTSAVIIGEGDLGSSHSSAVSALKAQDCLNVGTTGVVSDLSDLALLLMQAAVSRRYSLLKSDAYMCKCRCLLSLKPPSPLVDFCPHSAWPSLPSVQTYFMDDPFP